MGLINAFVAMFEGGVGLGCFGFYVVCMEFRVIERWVCVFVLGGGFIGLGWG